MQFFDCWKTLNARFNEGDMTAQTQLVGYKLLAIFNERMFPEWLPLTDRELQSRTNIKSRQTIVAARRALKNAGLIDFNSPKNKSKRYRLTVEHESNTNQAPIKHQSSTNQAGESVPYMRAREDIKTFKTKDVKTSSAAEDDAHGRTCVNRNSKIAKLPNTENTDMDIHDIWEYETGYPLTGSLAYELEELANDDFDLVHKAIIKAVASKMTDRLRYNYFKKIYDDMKTPKGGVKRDRNSSTILGYSDSDAPDVSWIYEDQNVNGTNNRLV